MEMGVFQLSRNKIMSLETPLFFVFHPNYAQKHKGLVLQW